MSIKFKKILAILLSFVLIIGLAACGSAPEQSESQQDTYITQTDDSGDEAQDQDVLASEAYDSDEDNADESESSAASNPIDEDGWYYSKDEVALYIWTYGHLPGNYITKNEAKKLGWEGGSVERYAEGKAIGGDKFGNYEGLLPEDYKYYECDIDTDGADSRGAKRIIFAEGGELIYYTEDHYESFELLYGEE